MRTAFMCRRVPSVLAMMGCMVAAAAGQVHAQANVLVRHNDRYQTGANLSETTLNTLNVNTSTFGKLFGLPADGYIYAQPLYVSNLAIAGGSHNVVFVATAHNTVYAYDADNGTLYWSQNLGPSVPESVIHTGNMLVEIGITSTPVIDLASHTIYVVPKTYFNSVQQFYFHALDITTGAEKGNSPIPVTATFPGTGDANVNGLIPFQAAMENQRMGLTEANGNIYMAFASHEDHDPYHGWVLSYNASTLLQTGVFNNSPNGGEGGIWDTGQALPVDNNGNLYCMSGNTSQTSDTSAGDYGQSFIKLAPNLTVADYYKDYNFDLLNGADLDLGSGGPTLIPGSHFITGCGKFGREYVVDTDNMGHLFGGGDVVQQWLGPGGGSWGSSVWWNNTLYIWNIDQPCKAFAWNPATNLFNTSPSSDTGNIQPANGDDPNPAQSISANGTTPGSALLWASIPTQDPDHAVATAMLAVFDATNLSHELWDSRMVSADGIGNYAKFVPPTIANGKVYCATNSGEVYVFGLKGNPTPPPAPVELNTLAGNGTASLSWTGAPGASSYHLYRGTNPGGEVSLVSGVSTTSYNDTGLTNGVTYYYQVAGVNSAGEGPRSMEASATPVAPSTNPVASFKADTISGISNGGVLSTWPDSSGGGFNATVPSGSSAPTLATGSLNGLSVVHFNGSNQMLAFNRPVAGDFTITAVFRSGQGIGTATPFYAGAGIVQAEVPQVVNDFGVSLNANGSILAGTGNPDTTVVSGGGFNNNAAHVVTFERVQATGALSVFIDGNAAGTGTGGTQQLTSPTQIGLGATVGNISYLKGDIAEVEVYNSALSTSARQTLESGLITKWGIGAPQVPSTPTGLTASAGSGQVSLTWSAGNGATSYNVYRGTAAGSESGTPISTGLTATSYVNTGLTNGTAYYYKVAAVNAAGTSPLSSEVSATPAMATGGPIANGTYVLTPKCALGSRLDAASQGTAPGTNVEIWQSNSGANQKWVLTNISGSTYKITPSYANPNNLVIETVGGGGADGTRVDLGTDTGAVNQRWTVTSVGGGSYTLAPTNAIGENLDVNGASSNNGAQIILWHNNSSDNAQLWTITAGP